MKRVLLAVVTAGLVTAAVVLSGRGQAPTPVAAPSNLAVTVENRNPWTHLRLNNDADDFQFVIVSDRTGGHREKVFSRAVEQINLLQPEFVLSVGDLIEGYTKDPEKAAAEWREFQSYTARLQMPFFYVPARQN